MAAPLRATVAPEEAVRNGILCLAHGCDSKRTKIFSFSFPAICPVCNEDLTQSELPLPPFRIPFPFVRAQQRALSLVIRPTQGDFLHDYGKGVALHIGVTNSLGDVFEYDVDGLLRSPAGSAPSSPGGGSGSSEVRDWSECLSLQVLPEEFLDSMADVWDETLDSLQQDSEWTAERYDETDHNCYSFVMGFLRMLDPPGLSLSSPTAFCQAHLVPTTSSAGRFISLYRRLRSQPNHLFVHQS